MKTVFKTLNFIVIIIMVFSISFGNYTPARAGSPPVIQDDGVRIGYNEQTGKVSFIGADPSKPIIVRSAQLQGLKADKRALMMVSQYAQDFGLQNPSSELRLISADEAKGREATRFQQIHNGIPVIGGEMIVNADDRGGLLSLSGEISPDLSIDTTPAISAEEARETALQMMAKWNETALEDFTTTQPELWIYDPRLLGPEAGPVSLVWRMDVTSVNSIAPIRELVLIDAKRGSVVLHFNQTDTAWHIQTEQSGEAPLPNMASIINTLSNTQANVNIQSGTTWYVATTGNDSNSCIDSTNPCLTINGAIGRAANGDTIKVASGTYTGNGTEVVLINKSVTLSGGWNASFTSQDETSIIDGQQVRRGIAVSGGTVAVDHFTIQNGSHAKLGGGIYNSAILTLSNSIVKDNVNLGQTVGGDSMGGGIYNSGTLTINNTTISGNTAGDPCCGAGGAYGGGGIGNYYGTVILNNSLVIGNTILGGYPGSGINSYFGTLILNNSTVSGNRGGNGEGIYTSSTTTVLNNITISGNQSYGIFHMSGTLTLQNTIIAQNGTHGDCNSNGGTFNSQGYNLIGNKPAGCTFTATTGDLVGTSANPIDPQFAPLQDNGGTTFTHALMVGSPAIDAGNPAMPGIGGNACLSTDQRGTTRPVNTRCDIGAYEGSVPWVPLGFANTYTANHNTFLPGTFLCNQTQLNCTNNANPDADAAHRYALGTYIFYASQHNRDSIDNNDMVITSSVDYGVNYDNAFWNGSQMVYGDAYGFPLADDVVAHELTHGVTQYESNLFYYYQSGAINESFSDIWGELYDQSNSQGNDAPGVKWLMGEDVSGMGALRSMSNPPTYGDPDKITSSYYYTGETDNGGVHTNSGVNNKAAYLMVEAGSFNGKTVTALGTDKTLAIYYEVQTNLLTSGADYGDLYNALYQACLNLVGGPQGITSGDCQEVRDATDAVLMNAQPIANPGYNPDVPVCANGQTPTSTLLFDDMESGTGNWIFNNGASAHWQYDSPYGSFAHSGSHFLYADDYPAAVTDAKATLPAVVIPSGAYLHFSHAYDFEHYDPSYDPNYYDGGVLEYSINGGATWQDAGSLMEFNGYDGTIYPGWSNPAYDNPLKGRSAFVGTSHGYISTRLDLNPLAGKTVQFRWRMGLDQGGLMWGWWVDDVRIYTCPTNTDVYIGSNKLGSYDIPQTFSSSKDYTSTMNGPVRVVSTDGLPVLTSQRAFYGNSFNELMGYPADQFTTEYWFPWYDNVFMQTWILVGNPSTTDFADVEIYIGGGLQMTASIPPNGRVTPAFAGLLNGPVRVVCTNCASYGGTIFASERSLYGDSFSEVMGYPDNQLTTEYWFPWYDQVYMQTWILVGNPSSAQTAYVDIYIGGAFQMSSAIPPDGRITPVFPSVLNGPVQVISTTGAGTPTPLPIFASERSLYGTSFNEVMGYPKNRFTTDYFFPWYDNAGMQSWVLVGNPSSTQTAYVEIYIGGALQMSTSIPPNGRITPQFAANTGPVRVLSTTGAGTPSPIDVFTSERSLYGTSFNEMMAYPANRLTTEYWFTWYDNVFMSTDILLSRP